MQILMIATWTRELYQLVCVCNDTGLVVYDETRASPCYYTRKRKKKEGKQAKEKTRKSYEGREGILPPLGSMSKSAARSIGIPSDRLVGDGPLGC